MTTLRHTGFGFEPIALHLPHIEVSPEARMLATLAAAPFIGLAFILALPFAGLVVLATFIARALVAHRTAIKDVALFFAAPFVGLAYIALMPFVGLGALLWTAAKAVTARAH